MVRGGKRTKTKTIKEQQESRVLWYLDLGAILGQILGDPIDGLGRKRQISLKEERTIQPRSSQLQLNHKKVHQQHNLVVSRKTEAKQLQNPIPETSTGEKNYTSNKDTILVQVHGNATSGVHHASKLTIHVSSFPVLYQHMSNKRRQQKIYQSLQVNKKFLPNDNEQVTKTISLLNLQMPTSHIKPKHDP